MALTDWPSEILVVEVTGKKAENSQPSRGTVATCAEFMHPQAVSYHRHYPRPRGRMPEGRYPRPRRRTPY